MVSKNLPKDGSVVIFEERGVSIAFLQETHLEDKDNVKLQRNWVGQVFATSYSSFSRGVAILVSKNIAFRSHRCVKDNLGCYVTVKGVLSGKDVTFMNVYCPPGYSPVTKSDGLMD